MAPIRVTPEYRLLQMLADAGGPVEVAKHNHATVEQCVNEGYIQLYPSRTLLQYYITTAGYARLEQLNDR